MVKQLRAKVAVFSRSDAGCLTERVTVRSNESSDHESAFCYRAGNGVA